MREAYVDLLFIVAVHNRREVSLRSVSQAARSARLASRTFRIFVFDDGSSDGTADAILRLHPEVCIIEGSGAAFWARGMSSAERRAVDEVPDFGFLVWLNDDVSLDDDFVERALHVAHRIPGSVIACATRGLNDDAATYGGLVRSGLHPLSFKLVQPSHDIVSVDTMNGNIVFVPAKIHGLIGGIDGNFAHGLADIDYGCRARRAGVDVVLAPGTYGSCARNEVPSFRTRRQAWVSFVGVRGGGNLHSLRRILRKLRPLTWPLWLAATYANWWRKRAQPNTSYKPY